MARIWRDWGFPNLALPHAYRAVPRADRRVPHNTLGTILWSLGHGDEARAEFERALKLDACAAYALNNLCYSWLMEARDIGSSGRLPAALALAPNFTVARNNLGLVLRPGGRYRRSRGPVRRGGHARRRPSTTSASCTWPGAASRRQPPRSTARLPSSPGSPRPSGAALSARRLALASGSTGRER